MFTEDEWKADIPNVVKDMIAFLRPYRTAIYEDCNDYGKGWGSGSYLRLGERVFILTNEHVSQVRGDKILAHQFDGQDDIRRIVGNHVEYPDPLDLALLPVDMQAWSDTTNTSKAIDLEQISLAHIPVGTELLAFTGFAGENVSFHFNTLCAQASCYVAREVELP